MSDKEQNISERFIRQLYSDAAEFKTDDGTVFEVPADGSLGLLAMGYRGVIAVRKKKIEERKLEKLEKQEKQDKSGKDEKIS